MKNIAKIETLITMEQDAKILSLVRKCIKLQIPIYISNDDFEAHQEILYKPAGHKLYTPKWVYNGKTIRQLIKEGQTCLPASIIRGRLKAGWNWEDALTIPRGEGRPKARRRFASLAHSKRKLVVVGTIQGKEFTSDKIAGMHKIYSDGK